MSLSGEVRRLLEAEGLERDVAARLGEYAGLLERWARVHNLVRFQGARDLVERHLLDALAGVPALEGDAGLVVDVGSGAGLPGLPLLIACPGWRGILVEPRQKRWAFLRAAVRELGLQAEVARVRYQELEPPGAPAVVTARALGGHDGLLRWARPWLGLGGKVVLWVGEEEARRLEALPGWRVVSSPLPTLDRGFLAQLRPCFT